MSITNFYEHCPDNPQSLVIMLHGVGSNGQDLISLAPYLAQSLPNTAFVSSDAPFVCDMVPPEYPNAYQWFSLQNRDPHVLLDGVKTVMPLVGEFVIEQAERFQLPLNKVALLGFSQGTMTSLHVAPRLKDKIAGVLGYSGALLWDENGSKDLKTMPICLIHGESDDIVPVEARAHAIEKLESAGFTLSGHTTPGLAHSIDQKGIDAGSAFLKEILS